MSDANAQFLSVNHEILRLLMSYGKKSFISKGTTFIIEGEESDCCYLILEGDANILKKNNAGVNENLATIGKGSIIGEMGVFQQEKRSSSVQAITGMVMLKFSAEEFYDAVKNTPELAMRIIKSLADKLNTSNKLSMSARQ